jgi:hypothetical protein
LRTTGRRQAGPEDRGHRDHDPDVEGRLAEPLGHPLARPDGMGRVDWGEQGDDKRGHDEDQERMEPEGQHATDHDRQGNEKNCEWRHVEIVPPAAKERAYNPSWLRPRTR